MKFHLGQKVKVSRQIYKRRDSQTRTKWVVSPLAFREPRVGTIVGHRTLKEGVTHYSHDDMPVFIADAYISAYMIALSLREKPVFALEENIEAVEAL